MDMAGKKNTIPQHIPKKQFEHPGKELCFIQALEQIEDPRSRSFFLRHSLVSMLFMIVVAQICGANDWPKIVVFSNSIMDWLAQYVDMSSGVPCERTFKNVMNAIDPLKMEILLRDIADSIRERIPNEVIAFDGQTSRGTAELNKNVNGIHLVNAWSPDNSICLGQIKVDDKSNEIIAMPMLMEQLDLKGTIITADALNTQRTTAAKAVEKEADYLLPVKANHSNLLADIKLAFRGLDEERRTKRKQWERSVGKAQEQRDVSKLQNLIEKGPPSCATYVFENEIEKSHGRVEIRKCTTMCAKKLSLEEDWKGIQSLVRIERERTTQGKSSTEIVYYISSLKPDKAQLIAEAIREHWSVENGLHWRLDVIFRQDKSRYRDRIGARNLAVIRKIVLNALSRDTSLKGGMATKQFAACCNPAYRSEILKKVF
jgi:predicted transposase YbfD/YdcC